MSLARDTLTIPHFLVSFGLSLVSSAGRRHDFQSSES